MPTPAAPAARPAPTATTASAASNDGQRDPAARQRPETTSPAVCRVGGSKGRSPAPSRPVGQRRQQGDQPAGRPPPRPAAPDRRRATAACSSFRSASRSLVSRRIALQTIAASAAGSTAPARVPEPATSRARRAGLPDSGDEQCRRRARPSLATPRRPTASPGDAPASNQPIGGQRPPALAEVANLAADPEEKGVAAASEIAAPIASGSTSAARSWRSRTR